MTIRQKIIKISSGRFRVLWDAQKYQNFALMLDFNPIINHFDLDNLYSDYCLLHWQARPVGLRRWGIYNRKSDQYMGCDYDKLTFDNVVVQLLQVDELKLVQPPSAVVLLPNHCLHTNGNIVNCRGITDGVGEHSRSDSNTVVAVATGT